MVSIGVVGLRIVDYSMQAKTLKKLSLGQKQWQMKLRKLLQTRMSVKVELIRKCKSCGGMDFENDTKKETEHEKCGYVDEHNVEVRP